MSHKNIIIPKDEWIPIVYDKVFKKVRSIKKCFLKD